VIRKKKNGSVAGSKRRNYMGHLLLRRGRNPVNRARAAQAPQGLWTPPPKKKEKKEKKPKGICAR